MAKPDIKNGYAPIANELIRCAFSKINFSAYESRIIWTVIGISFSWQRAGGYTTFRELAIKSGIDLRHVQRTVKGLIKKQVLLVREGDKKTWIELNTDYMTWSVPESVDNLFPPENVLPVEATNHVACRGYTESPENHDRQRFADELKKLL